MSKAEIYIVVAELAKEIKERELPNGVQTTLGDLLDLVGDRARHHYDELTKKPPLMSVAEYNDPKRQAKKRGPVDYGLGVACDGCGQELTALGKAQTGCGHETMSWYAVNCRKCGHNQEFKQYH